MDIIFAGGKFRAKSQFANIPKMSSTRKIGVIQYSIAGYHDTLSNTRHDSDDGHGGVGIYINENMSLFKRDDLTIFIPHVIESLFVEVKINTQKSIIVGVIYWPNTQPHADMDLFADTLSEITSTITNENKESYMMGNFNIDLL